MSVVIRMQRAGGRNYPFYRVVVADSRRARDGRFLEKLGYYNPLAKPFVVSVDQERVRYWMDRGALPSESVASLLKRAQAPGVQPSNVATAVPARSETKAPAAKAPEAAPAAAEAAPSAPAVAEAASEPTGTEGTDATPESPETPPNAPEAAAGERLQD